MIKVASLRFSPRSSSPTTASRDILDRFYMRVLGFGYQVLGDAELAAQAAEAVFLRSDPPMTEVAVWAAAMATLRSYLVRGFVVRPLVPLTQGWQAELLSGLAQLAPEERALLVLRYHEGLEIDVLAQIWGRSEREIRDLVAAARGRLIDAMKDDD